MAKSPVWQRKAGKNPNGGLNEAGRRSLKAAGHDIKRPQPEGGSRRDSFCARMKGMKAKLTSSETANDPDSRINKSLRAWNCADGGAIRPEMGGGGDALKAAMKIAQNVIRAYHGSPHKFDKFDISKIGSGVGGQLHGSGLYFAGEEPIAREYRDGLSRYTIGVDGKPLPDTEHPIVKAAAKYSPEANDYISALNRQKEKLIQQGSLLDPRSPDAEMDRMLHEAELSSIEEKLRALSPYAGKRFGDVSTGHMYEVNLNTSPEKLLDWRKPYHQQSEHVRNVLDELKVPVVMRDPFGSKQEIPTPGYLAYSHLGKDPDKNFFRQGRASDVLKEAGVPGITYTDDLTRSSSRPAGVSDYPSNYVMFDDKLIDILRRYAQGGEVRPELGGGGDAVKAAVKMAQDIIKAYHGSPHKFDKFDISKIGTGEGAQAYGHGLYFAGNEDVARSYRDALAHKADPRGGINDVIYQFAKARHPVMEPTRENIQDYMRSTAGVEQYAENKAILDRVREIIAGHEPGGTVSGDAMHAYRELEHLLPEPSKGHMYEVGLRANPERMLDWDKPISSQPHISRGLSQYVNEMGGQQRLQQYAKELEAKRAAEEAQFAKDWESDKPLDLSSFDQKYTSKEALSDLLNDIRKGRSVTGKDFYRSLAPNEYDYKGATETAKRLGIPGIQYLDQGSRMAGEGSRNYVMFDPSLIDIMRRYADGGRIGFDEGGLARIEELIRQAKGEEAVKEASHPVGMSANVEFAPVEIDEPITGKKIPLGSLPAPTAAVVNPAANILAQYGPYAMGPIPAGMAAARDLVTGLKEGSGLDVATAAMGAPGKLAKYGLPALGAVTDLISPTEAQAGTGSKLIKGLSNIALRRPELFRAEHPYFPEGFRDQIAGIVSPFSNDEDIAKAAIEMAQKYRTPLENKSNITGGYYGPIQSVDPLNVTRKIGDIPGIKLLQPTLEQTYEDLYKVGKGGTLINLAGDRSDFGRLTHIGGKKLDFPVDVHAGPKYSLEPNPGEVWANAPEHAGKLRDTLTEAEKTGPAIGLYTPMGPQSISSSQHMFEALMAQIKGSGASKADLKAFDDMLRRGEHFSAKDESNRKNAINYMSGDFGGKNKVGPWPGLSNPKAAAEWAKNLPGHHRAAIVNEMEKARWKKLGFPEVGVTRVALTDPSLMATPQNLMGGRASMLSTKNPRGAEPLFQHSTYGSPTYGEYLMDLPYVQRQYAMPEAIKKYTSPTETGTVVHPYSEQSLGRGSFRKLFETNFLTQPINQEWLDTIMTGLERQKQYGFNRGGKAS